MQAISGIGLIQNSDSAQQWEMGNLSMPAYFNRTLQNQDTPWNFSAEPFVDLLTISLGGNDYNHQHGNVPTNQSFTEHSAAFFAFLFRAFNKRQVETGSLTQIMAVCGMGDPEEVKIDPDNNRCRPCPHVADAVASFRVAHPSLASRLHYLFVPCDGTVITGLGDIGCNGHKNRLGQEKVAEFIAPFISSILGW